jgi:MULE transposase domain
MLSPTHPLLPNPPNIFHLRKKLFSLAEEFATAYLSESEHKIVWPYMSNVWSISKTEKSSITDATGFATSYYQCRFKRTPDATTSSNSARNNSRRLHEETKCECRMRVRFHLSAGFYEYTPKSGFPHTHTLDEMDMAKINDAVKKAVEAELAKGYSAATVANNFLSKGREGAYLALEIAGGKYLQRAMVQSWKQGLGLKTVMTDSRRTKASVSWEEELQMAEQICQELGYRYRILSVPYKESTSYGIVWASNHRLEVLADRGHLTTFDSTHKTNMKEWKLFTFMCRTEVGIQLPAAGALLASENSDIIAGALKEVGGWIQDLQKEWAVRYFMTDDSAAEQKAVKLAFGEGEVTHLLCRWHCKETLNRQLKGQELKEANKHLMAALFDRRSVAGCDESIQAALDSVPDDLVLKRNGKDWYPKKYIEREWKNTKEKWANAYRVHEYILMQIGTTGANESWHLVLKTALGLPKSANSTYSLAGVIQTFEDCSRNIDNRVVKALRQWRTKELTLCDQFNWLKRYPFPAQIILAKSIQLAEERQAENSQPIDGLDERGECDCTHFRKWYLPCQHMLEQYMFGRQDVEPNWDKYASLFAEQKFDVYERKNVDIDIIEVGQGSQGDRTMERAMARSKLDLDETANRIRDRRFFIQDRLAESRMPVEKAERVMRGFNQMYASMMRKLDKLTMDELERIAEADSVFEG